MKEQVEIIKPDSKFRVFVDIDIAGNANGGRFFNVKGLKEEVKKIEKSGKVRFVGLVYDDTNRLEILTQDINDDTDKLNKIILD
jgi:hypothetical protein